jgi:hypothetical protein
MFLQKNCRISFYTCFIQEGSQKYKKGCLFKNCTFILQACNQNLAKSSCGKMDHPHFGYIKKLEKKKKKTKKMQG